MRVLLTGATGLIGSAVLARLRQEGHEVVAVARPGAVRGGLAPAAWVVLDLCEVAGSEDWRAHLAGVDAVVNCAGVLQDSPRDSTSRVHERGVAALFAACEAAGVRRVVHVSALGVAADAPTAFSRSKHAGERALMARDLDWVILRPSVVVGRAAYGGSALLRGLAALPFAPQIADAKSLQIVQLDDLVRTIALLVQPHAPARVVLDVVGPEALGFEEIVQAYRRWQGRPPARQVRIPVWVQHVMFRLGDLAGGLGWRPPLRTTARMEIVRAVAGDAEAWRRITGIEPQSLQAALAGEPASVQERWFAGLYLLKPLAIATLSLFWIVTGLVSLGPGWNAGGRLITEAGLGGVGSFVAVSGAVADIAVGIAISIRRSARGALRVGLGLSILYLLVGTLLLPGLWLDPLGPFLKVVPILVLHLMVLAILDER